jgi:hypothetical protein
MLLCVMARAPHGPCAPQMLHELLFQRSTGLNVESAVDRLVGHVLALVARVFSLQPTGNLLRRPLPPQLMGYDLRQVPIFDQFACLGAKCSPNSDRLEVALPRNSPTPDLDLTRLKVPPSYAMRDIARK